ncbi:MAG: hypothetical protein Q9217_006386 [Psora testacea]
MIIFQPSRHLYLTRIIIAFVTIVCIIVLIPGHSNSHTFLPSLSVFHPASKSNPSNDPKWLLAIFLSPSNISRRAVIRSTWATRYQNPSYEYRFIIGNFTTSPWAPAIEAENATYGDIWMLEDFTNENHETANRIKNMEFFKYLVRHQGTRVRRYDFVSKIDDDNWFNIPPYYETFIAPRLPGREMYDPSALTMIGRPMVWTQEYAYASGRIYTVSWSLLEFFVQKYTANPISEKTEDELAGLYLYEDKVQHKFVPLELEQAWDIGLEYLVNNETMIIHCIKHDERLLEVSTMFDSEGRWNGKMVSGLTDFDRTMKEVVERVGQPSAEEMEQLKTEREKGDRGKNPWETLDWKLIEANIRLEDREKMGTMYPLSLPGNNASTGVVPQPLYLGKRPAQHGD